MERKFKSFGNIKKIKLDKAISGNDILEVTYKDGSEYVFIPRRSK